MILIALGGNLTNDKFKTSLDVLDAALSLLEKSGVKILKKSSYFASAPVPRSDQGWFVNSAAKVSCTENPQEFLKILHDVENKMGRVRKKHWGERLIDIDLIAYGDKILPSKAKWNTGEQLKNLVLPHPLMHVRHFVLCPLEEVAPDWHHPIFHKTIREMLKETPPDGEVRKIARSD
jgi:2-amino-4-hydroxy-6-hydroxymethyldihydropteridine diphosphokinase